MILQQYEFENLKMIPFQAGFLDNNTYLLADTTAKECVVIDPSSGFEQAVKKIRQEGWNLNAFWLTHAHFDHVINAHYAAEANPPIPIAMHPADELIRASGGIAKPDYTGIPVGCPKPSVDLADGMILKVGDYDFTVLHTPGHSPGSCCFYCKSAGWLFSGDLVFYESYGRTDLIGSNTDALFRSIREKVLVLPDETVIFPGHNDFTSVEHEKKFY
jgi:glyoxylase-like metal-dependent hydrolase (beta-lactamase superfamily II)